MKDHIKEKLVSCTAYDDVKTIIDDYMDYYNNRRYQWHLAKLSPNEYYKFITTGIYPLDIANVPPIPVIAKKPEQLGENKQKNWNHKYYKAIMSMEWYKTSCHMKKE